MFLDYFALGVLIVVALILFYAIIAIHDIPYEVSVRRHHPHQDAIHAAGWVSLFTLHVLWPFLWIWAMLYRPDRGWGFAEKREAVAHPGIALVQLEERITALERRAAADSKPAPSQPVEKP
jgi:Protein of unknown function (DUF3302)